ncbi:Phosphoribosylglycinamide formyltransferase, chloroplastic [Linum perenne]
MESRCFLSDFCSNSVPSFKRPLFPSRGLLRFNQAAPKTAKNLCFKRLECVHVRAIQITCSDASDQGNEEEKKKSWVARKKLAVFVSGGGSNFKSIHQACLQGSIHGDVVALITNKTDCGGAKYAREEEIPVLEFPVTKDGADAFSPAALIRRFEVDFVILAGFLKLIPVELIRAYPRAILNIHPSLLPAFGGKGFYGMKVHKAVIASGARYSGPTIHYVDEQYDTGRILAQRIVPVLSIDTPEDLAARVLQEEHKLYREVVAALCEERIVWREDDGVPLIQSRENPNHFC